jgi:hypothetical protein
MSENIQIFAITALLSTLVFILGMFTKFHIKLLFSNVTTIEDLERKRSGTFHNVMKDCIILLYSLIWDPDITFIKSLDQMLGCG